MICVTLTIGGFYQRQGMHILPPQIFLRLNFSFTTWTETAFRKKVIKMLHIDVLCMQIWDCNLHQNVFGGRAPPGPAGGAIALPQTP